MKSGEEKARREAARIEKIARALRETGVDEIRALTTARATVYLHRVRRSKKRFDVEARAIALAQSWSKRLHDDEKPDRFAILKTIATDVLSALIAAGIIEIARHILISPYTMQFPRPRGKQDELADAEKRRMNITDRDLKTAHIVFDGEIERLTQLYGSKHGLSQSEINVLLFGEL